MHDDGNHFTNLKSAATAGGAAAGGAEAKEVGG